MIKICSDSVLCREWKEAYQKEEHKTFFISENLFLEVRDYAHANQVEDGTCFSVLDKDGKFLFLIQYIENLTLGTKRNDFWEYEERFLNEKDLDFSLLDQYHTFVFTETEEYSIAIAGLLQKYRPDIRCIFLDRRAGYFIKGKSVRCLPFSGVSGRYMELFKKWMQGKNQNLGFFKRAMCLLCFKIIKYLGKRKDTCIIATDKKYLWPVDNIYNSPKVMYSILWCKNKKTLGNRNEDKTIVLLDYPCFFEGLVSIMKWTYSHIEWLSEKGFIPVVHLHTLPNQYLNSEEENMWEYFFEPVSDISIKEAYESKNVISAADNGIILGENKINPYQEKWISRPLKFNEFNKIIKVNAETEKYMEEEMPKEFHKGARVLGVVMRGTGFRKEVAEKWHKEWRMDIVDAQLFLQACNYYKDELKCEYIFVATEDAEYFEMVQKFFTDGLLFVEQKRIDYDYANNENIPVKEVLGVTDGKVIGRSYLTVIKSLAECNALIYNVNCGAVGLAQCWNDGKYELDKCIESSWQPPA